MSSDSVPSDSDSAKQYVGLKVANLFTIDALVGSGASAHAFRATQVGIERSVAIKIMHRDFLSSREMRARFHREARIAARITHPAVVPVLMTGELPDSPPTHAETFIVYEFVEGRTLRTAIEQDTLQLPEIVGILIAAGEAVGAAHQVGIVHRDLKPENLMLVREPSGTSRLRVLDFGLARICEPTELPLTHTGAVLGTPNYLSPEGARGQPATAQSDVYSLAIIAYECLMGQPPFVDLSTIGVLMKQIESEPVPLQRTPRLGEVPPLIAAAIMTNLDKSPDRRAANASAFAQALRAAAEQSLIAIESCEPSTDLWQTGASLNQKPFPEPRSATDHKADTRSS
jgi:eukaryotic-like serine/threonine-protein kinase